MLSKASGGASKNVSSYYQEQSYYNQNSEMGMSYYREDGNAPMTWFGAGAENHGLTGEFKEGDFQKFDKMLKDGEIDGKKVQAQSNGEERRYGEDFTFSTPKSFSIAGITYGDSRLKEAFADSVQEIGVKELEKHFGARQKIDGETNHVKARAFGAVAMHETSRPAIDKNGTLHIDPQLHAHVIFANLAEREDGEIRASHWQKFKTDTLKEISAKVDADFYNRAVALGYELEKRGDSWEIKGIDHKTCEFMSARSKDNIEKELEKMGLTRENASAELKQSLAYSTRNVKADLTKDEVLALQKENLEKLGVYQSQKDYVDAIKNGVRKAEIEMTPERKEEIIKDIKSGLRHLSERESVFKEDKLSRHVIENSDIFITDKEIKQFQKEAGALISTKTGDTETFLTTKEALARDEKIITNLELGKGSMMNDSRKATQEEVERAINNLEYEKGYTLTDDQKNAISVSVKSDDRYVVIQGIAGTGKSVSAEAIKDIYLKKGYEVQGLAQTHKASDGLSEVGIDSKTIAKWANEGATFEKNSVVIIDEAGLISSKDMLKIMNAAEKAEAKVILIGDQLQMRSIEAGGPFVLIQDHGADKAVLNTVMRQENQDIKEIVNDFGKNDTKSALEKLSAFAHEVEKGSSYDEKINNIAEKAAEIYLQRDIDKTIIITDTNNMRNAVNDHVREALQEKGIIGKEEETIQSLRSIDSTKESLKKVSTFQEAMNEREKVVVVFNKDYERGFKYTDELAQQNRIELKKEVNVEKLIQKGEEYKLVGVDTSKKEVYLEAPDGQKISWTPSATSKVSIYEQSDMKLSVGDEITFKENTKYGDQEIKSGDSAKITDIKGDTITVELKNGETINLQKDETIKADYAYAQTVHSTQGIKSDNVVVAVNSSSMNIDANLLNVAASRAVNDLDVVTDSTDNLKRNSDEFKFNENATDFSKDEDRNKYNLENETQNLHNPEYSNGNSGPTESPQDTQRGQEAAQDGREQGQSTERVPSEYPESTQPEPSPTPDAIPTREPEATTTPEAIHTPAPEAIEFKENNSIDFDQAISALEKAISEFNSEFSQNHQVDHNHDNQIKSDKTIEI